MFYDIYDEKYMYQTAVEIQNIEVLFRLKQLYDVYFF